MGSAERKHTCLAHTVMIPNLTLDNWDLATFKGLNFASSVHQIKKNHPPSECFSARLLLTASGKERAIWNFSLMTKANENADITPRCILVWACERMCVCRWDREYTIRMQICISCGFAGMHVVAPHCNYAARVCGLNVCGRTSPGDCLGQKHRM